MFWVVTKSKNPQGSGLGCVVVVATLIAAMIVFALIDYAVPSVVNTGGGSFTTPPNTFLPSDSPMYWTPIPK